MTTKVMFMTIGMRDCHLVYEDAVQGRVRWSAPIKDIAEFDRFMVLNPQGVKEKKLDRNADKQAVGLCFPMLSKAISYLKDRGETKLDYLFLISTNRKLLLPRLEQIRDLLEKAELIDDMYEYLDQGLIRHAREDTISEAAHLIKQSIQSKRVPLFGMEISQIEILDLGTYGFFDDILNADLNKPLNVSMLKKADINVLDFFESEAYTALKPFFGFLEEAKIYLAINAGGMPQMQKGVEQVLKSMVAHADYEQIYNSEFLWYQLESQPQGEFLLLLRQMTDNVISLDWDSAYARFVSLKAKHANKLGSSRLAKLEKIFKAVLAARKKTNPSQWFENFCTLIFQALYRMNLNDVAVWLKCIEEAAYGAMLQKQCGKLWERVETIPDSRGTLKKHVFIKDSESQKLSLIDAYPAVINGIFDKQTLLDAFEPYAKVFMEEGVFRHSEVWSKMRLVRNRLIHKGIPVTNDPASLNLILDFIGVDLKVLNTAISHLQCGNLKALREFEQNCLNNKFFYPLRSIAGISSLVHTLSERKKCDEYLRMLYS